MIGEILLCEKASKGYSGQRQQHMKGTVIFCKVGRHDLGDLLWEDKVSEGCEGLGWGVRLRLDCRGQILVSCKQHLNIWLLFCRHWEWRGSWRGGVTPSGLWLE